MDTKLTPALLDTLLRLPKMIDWAIDAPDLGWQGDGGRCLIHRYLSDTLRELGIFTQFSVGADAIHFMGMRPFTHQLPADLTDLVLTVDHGATAWISRDRAMDIMRWLVERQKATAVTDAIASGLAPGELALGDRPETGSAVITEGTVEAVKAG